MKQNLFILRNDGKISQEYFNFLNKVTNLIRMSKKNYHSKLFSDIKKDCKQTWKVINKILKPDKERHPYSIESILYENNIYNDSDQFANIFNQHFSSVGQKISETFQNLPYDTT